MDKLSFQLLTVLELTYKNWGVSQCRIKVFRGPRLDSYGAIQPPFPPIAPYPHWRWGIPVKRGRISYNFEDRGKSGKNFIPTYRDKPDNGQLLTSIYFELTQQPCAMQLTTIL